MLCAQNTRAFNHRLTPFSVLALLGHGLHEQVVETSEHLHLTAHQVTNFGQWKIKNQKKTVAENHNSVDQVPINV